MCQEAASSASVCAARQDSGKGAALLWAVGPRFFGEPMQQPLPSACCFFAAAVVAVGSAAAAVIAGGERAPLPPATGGLAPYYTSPHSNLLLAEGIPAAAADARLAPRLGPLGYVVA